MIDVVSLDNADQSGWAVGTFSIILHKTENSGTWEVQSSHTSAQLFGVAFPDLCIGYAVGSNILKYSYHRP